MAQDNSAGRANAGYAAQVNASATQKNAVKLAAAQKTAARPAATPGTTGINPASLPKVIPPAQAAQIGRATVPALSSGFTTGLSSAALTAGQGLSQLLSKLQANNPQSGGYASFAPIPVADASVQQHIFIQGWKPQTL